MSFLYAVKYVSYQWKIDVEINRWKIVPSVNVFLPLLLSGAKLGNKS